MTKTRVQLPKEPTRKQQSRAVREAARQRWLMIGVAAVLIIIAGLVGYGFFNEQVLIPRQPVAKVGGVEITTQAFQNRLRYEYYNLQVNRSQLESQRAQFASESGLEYFVDQFDQQIAQIDAQLGNTIFLGKQILDDMIDEELIRQEAARRNIFVSADEVTLYVEKDLFGFYRIPPTPEPTLTPLPTPSVPITQTPEPTFTPAPSPTPISEAAFNAAYGNYKTQVLEQTGFSESEFRRLMESKLLQPKVLAAFEAETPASTEQLKFRYVRLESDQAIQVATGILAGGTPFDTFFGDVKAGQAISTTYGELDWTTLGELGQQLETRVTDQILSLAISQTTSVITDVFGSSYIFQVTGREVRALDETQKSTLGQKSFDDWLAARQAEAGVVDYLNERYLDVIPTDLQTSAQ